MIDFGARGARLAAAAFGAFALLTVLVVAGWTQPLDDWWDSLMWSAEMAGLVRLAELFHHLGRFPIAFVTTLVVAAAFVVAKRWWVAGAWVAIVATAEVLSVTTKMIVDRSRPIDGLVRESSAAYPSGHAMVSGAAIGFGLAVLLAMLWPHRARLFLWLGAIYAALMAWSRTYLHAHWLTDVVGGLLFGVVVVFLFGGIFESRIVAERTSSDPAA